VPETPVWIAGCGPLAFLYAIQLLDVVLRSVVSSTHATEVARITNILSLLKARGAPTDLLKGVKARVRLKAAGRYVATVKNFRAEVPGPERISYTKTFGKKVISMRILMVHEGPVPVIHPTMS
jgi:hypothetical protein